MPAGPQEAEEVTRASGHSGYPTGWRRYVYSTNHKDIGMMYLVFAIVAGLIGAFLSVMMRVELAVPGLQIFEYQNTFNVFVTGHGLIMVFFVVLPALIGGFGNYFVPLMIGARDMAFPRLNNLSFWLLPGALTLMTLSWFVEGESGGMGVGGGWALSPPLSTSGAPGPAVDFAIFSLQLAGVSSIFGAINFIATIFNMRAPGMSLHEMPHFVWALLVTAFVLVLTLPVFVGAITMVLTDRNFGTTFFNPAGGGDPRLYRQLIGFFSLPEVYILILPGFGIVSQIVSTFSRKPVFGYLAMATAMVAMGVLGLIVWVSQMTIAATGLEPKAFFVLATMVVAVPACVMVFSCIATMWGGSIGFRTPMLWAIGFLFLFTIGGATGLVRANSGFDSVLHGTYHTVAHFHTVLGIGAIFALFAGWYYWFPKISGSMYNEDLAKAHFWLTLVGVNLTFFPMHFLGLAGMPRRAADYPDAYAGWNGVASAGSMISTAGLVVFFVCMAEALMRRRPAGKNPWGAGATTLEWRLTSPPPFQAYTRLPRIAGSSAR